MAFTARLRSLALFLAATSTLAVARLAGAPPQDEDEPARGGEWLYIRNCAGCHNDNGDGRGATILQLGLVARDFRQGGFAFGDSREQLARTISTGIPGTSLMPSFRGILSEEEIELVIDHLRSLMPPRTDEAPANTLLVVKDRPLIARGKLPGIVEGAPDVARGLLIGSPQGLTFEYDLGDVRFLGVRQGAFADREDWSDRGGGYLKPLGVVMHAVKSARPLNAPKMRLVSTWTRGASAGLVYDALDAAGARLARIEETQRVEGLSTGAAFTRVLSLTPAEQSAILPLEICDAQGSKWIPSPRERDPATKKARGPAWWICDLGEAGKLCVLVRARDGAKLALSWEPALSAGVALRPGAPLVLEASYIRTREWSPALGEKLAVELGQ